MFARTLLFLAAATTLVVWTLLAQEPAAPTTPPAAKKEPVGGPAALPQQPKPAPVPQTPAERIARALEQRVSLHFIETPLSEVVDYLSDKAKIPIRFDRKALGGVGIGTDVPITRTLADMRLRSVLRLVLRDLDLTYAIRDEVLLVTTQAEVNQYLETRVYPVKDLVERDVIFEDSSETSCDFRSLIDLITSTVAPTFWQDRGGPACIEGYGTSLVISVTGEVHDEIVELLGQLRTARDLWKTWDGKRSVPALLGRGIVRGTDTEYEGRVAKALTEKTEWRFVETPLAEAVKQIAARHHISIEFDREALAKVGISTDAPVTFVADQISLFAALRPMLREFDLALTIHDDALLITTTEETGTTLKVRTYPVFDLVVESIGARRPDFVGQFGGGLNVPMPAVVVEPIFDNTLLCDNDTLMDLISGTVQPKFWVDVGGPGSIVYHPTCRVLVIDATDEAHAEIETLLAKLRAVTPVPRKMSQEMFDEHERQVISHVFLLAGDSPERPMPEAKEIAETIRATISPEIWKTPANSLVPLRGRLRVVAPRKTVRAIDKLLRELDVLALPTPSRPISVPVPNAAPPAARP